MSWNHRVMRRTHSFKSDGKEYSEDCYEIHEVYYDDNDNIEGFTEDAIAPCGETIEELREELQRMLDCLDEPLLIYEDEVKKSTSQE